MKKKALICISVLALACTSFGCGEDPEPQISEQTGERCGNATCDEGFVCADAHEGKFCVKEIPPCSKDEKLSYDKETSTVSCKLSVTCNELPCALGQQCAKTEDGEFCVDEIPACNENEKLYYNAIDRLAYCEGEALEELVDACNNACIEGEKCLTPDEVINITEATCFAEDKITDDECANGLQLNADDSLTCAESQACGDITCEVGTYCTTALNGEGIEEQGCATAAVPDCESEGMLAEWQDDMTVLCIVADVRTCEDDSSCEEGYICDDTEKVCVEGTRDELGEYKFVRIDDLTDVNEACCGETTCNTNDEGKTVCDKEDPGADIDAIALKKADGSVTYAKRVVEYKNNFIEGISVFHNEDNRLALDPMQATGAPDSFFEYATEAGLSEEALCRYVREGIADGIYGPDDYTFVSLGGEGGYIIVEMDQKIEEGDTIDVLEVGDCKMITGDGSEVPASNVSAEDIKIQISINAEDGSWKTVVDKAKASNGLISVNIPAL